MIELDRLRVDALRSLARRHSVPGRAHLRRDELITLLAHAGVGKVVRPVRRAPSFGALRLRTASSAMSASERLGLEDTAGLGGPLSSGVGRRTETPLRESAIPLPELPAGYQDDRLVLLVRDPRTLFAYWDCHPETVRRARLELPDGEPTLRVLMLGGSEPQVARDITVDLDGPSYYVYDLEPNRDYRVELILRSPRGSDRLVLRASNVATLPGNRPSAWIEDRFAALPLEIPLPTAALFLAGRTPSDAERRMHSRAYELSVGPAAPATGDLPSSSQGIREGFGGRSWSGTIVRK